MDNGRPRKSPDLRYPKETNRSASRSRHDIGHESRRDRSRSPTHPRAREARRSRSRLDIHARNNVRHRQSQDKIYRYDYFKL